MYQPYLILDTSTEKPISSTPKKYVAHGWFATEVTPLNYEFCGARAPLATEIASFYGAPSCVRHGKYFSGAP
jgi:hypothetical protein